MNPLLTEWSAGDIRLLWFCLVLILALAVCVLVDELGGPRAVVTCCAAWLRADPSAIAVHGHHDTPGLARETLDAIVMPVARPSIHPAMRSW